MTYILRTLTVRQQNAQQSREKKPKYVIYIFGVSKSSKVQICNCNLVIYDGKCDTEIQMRIGIAKDIFWKLKRNSRRRELLLETKKNVQTSCEIS